MNYGRAILQVIMLTTITLVFGCCIFSRPQQGKVIENWETGNKAFQVRVIAYTEEAWGPRGAYYDFQAAVAGSSDWHEIMMFRHDDQPLIPRDQVRFVNDQTAYIFMGWMYAVTTDGGQTWSVWDASKNLPKWQCCNYRLIQQVDIAPDGRGTMKLNPIPERRGEVAEIHTKDFGQHWTIE